MSQENMVILCQYFARIANSRIGLVVIFVLYTASPWGLGPKLDEIRSNTALLHTVQEITIRNSERIAMLIERCQLKEEKKP